MSEPAANRSTVFLVVVILILIGALAVMSRMLKMAFVALGFMTKIAFGLGGVILLLIGGIVVWRMLSRPDSK